MSVPGDVKAPAVGALGDRVQFKRRDSAPAEEGGTTTTFVPIATLWARVRAVTARQGQAGDGRAALITHSVVLRYRSDIAPGDRLVFRGRSLEVIGADDLNGGRAYFELHVQRNRGDGVSMTHPITALQGALVAALKGDATLAGLVGAAIFDAPPRGSAAPYVVVARHDLVPRDGDLAPGNDHRVLLHLWHPDSNRAAVLALAERALAVLLEGALAPAGLLVTNRSHERTDTAIDPETGAARAALTLRFFTEPSA